MRYLVSLTMLFSIGTFAYAQALSTNHDMWTRHQHDMIGSSVITQPKAAPEIVQVLAQSEIPTVFVYSLPNCPPCLAMEKEVKGSKDYKFEFIKDSDKFPDWLYEYCTRTGCSLPVVHWKSHEDGWKVSWWAGLQQFKKQFPPKKQNAQRALFSLDAAPTPTKVIEETLNFLPKPEIAFVDFGCGDGRWCIAAAERWGMPVIGVEIDPARVIVARGRVQSLGLEHLVTIIQGDATQVDVDADVGVAYLYEDILKQLKPRIEKLRAFASYMHRPPDLPVIKRGDVWFYTQPAVTCSVQGAVWGGQVYSQPVCNNPNCVMCNSIRHQLGRSRK